MRVHGQEQSYWLVWTFLVLVRVAENRGRRVPYGPVAWCGQDASGILTTGARQAARDRAGLGRCGVQIASLRSVITFDERQ